MAFLLERGGSNLPLEVQRWQYFLRRQGFDQSGQIDGQFGLKTETATKFFQVQHGLPTSGKLDAATLTAAQGMSYTVVPDDHYDALKAPSFPPKPPDLRSPTNAARNDGLGCYRFKQLDLAHRADPDEIVILGDCTGSVTDWRKANIVTSPIVQPIFAKGFDGTITCHRLAAPVIQSLFALWQRLDLLHLVIAFDGAFSPRYKRGKSPSPQGHDVRSSRDVEALSNHAFGSAFDVNAADNPFGKPPAACPARGCVRELVAPANSLGFYWGGHFSAPKDGMHFEFARFN